jgi:hypothetical protein
MFFFLWQEPEKGIDKCDRHSGSCCELWGGAVAVSSGVGTAKGKPSDVHNEFGAGRRSFKFSCSVVWVRLEAMLPKFYQMPSDR